MALEKWKKMMMMMKRRRWRMTNDDDDDDEENDVDEDGNDWLRGGCASECGDYRGVSKFMTLIRAC